MNTYTQLTRQAEEYVKGLFSQADTTKLIYHDLEHTISVVVHSLEMAENYRLPENERAILLIAGWFHDTGHLYHRAEGHEERSAQVMTEFMGKNKVDEAFTEEVRKCIMATKTDTRPENLLQEIIRDADTYGIGTTDFKKNNKRLKKEFALRGEHGLLKDWDERALAFLQLHEYYTAYARETLNEQKFKNLAKYKKKLEKKAVKEGKDPALFASAENVILGASTNGFMNKGIQTMLRLTSENHLELSGMADGKANILISVNAIIISVILSVLIRKIEVDKHLAIPTFIFLFFSVATIILAILATRPQVTVGNFSRADVIHKKTNLLFFGNFFNTSLDEYKWAMSNLMQDPEYLYGSLVTDIHSLGTVLGRKYSLLRKAYTLFMIGIIITVVAFIIAIIFHDPQNNTVINSNATSPL